jgi:hypothetical protein
MLTGVAAGCSSSGKTDGSSSDAGMTQEAGDATDTTVNCRLLPRPGESSPCPVDPHCPTTYSDQLDVVAESDPWSHTDLCQGPAGDEDEIEFFTCPPYKWWVRGYALSGFGCYYSADGQVIGSADCTDTGCVFGGQIINRDTCADAGVVKYGCPRPDASTDGD